MVQSNITSLGSGPDPFLRYHKGFYKQLRHKFPGAETIEKNFSQTYQDMFTLSMLNGKKMEHTLKLVQQIHFMEVIQLS